MLTHHPSFRFRPVKPVKGTLVKAGIWSAGLLVLVSLPVCSSPTDWIGPTRQPPQVVEISLARYGGPGVASSTTLALGDWASLTVRIFEPDGDPVTCGYQAEHGKVSFFGDSCFGTASYVNDALPATADRITVIASDRDGDSAPAFASILIGCPQPEPPAVWYGSCPVPFWAEPSEGVTVSGTLALECRVPPNNCDWPFFEFGVSGAQNPIAGYDSPPRIFWNSSSIFDGPHTLRCTADYGMQRPSARICVVTRNGRN